MVLPAVTGVSSSELSDRSVPLKHANKGSSPGEIWPPGPTACPAKRIIKPWQPQLILQPQKIGLTPLLLLGHGKSAKKGQCCSTTPTSVLPWAEPSICFFSPSFPLFLSVYWAICYSWGNDDPAAMAYEINHHEQYILWTSVPPLCHRLTNWPPYFTVTLLS